MQWTLTAGGNQGSLTEVLSFDSISFLSRPQFVFLRSAISNTSYSSVFNETNANFVINASDRMNLSNFSSVFAIYNLVSTGGVGVTVFGSSFSDLGYSLMCRIGFTACETTQWISYSHLICKHAKAIKATRLVSVTVGLQSGSMSEAYSIAIPSISGPSRSNSANTGSVSVTIIGSSLGCASVTARLLHSASEATTWMSDSMILGMSTSTTHASRIIAFTAGNRDGSMTQAITFDFLTISTFNSTLGLRNFPSTCSAFISISGAQVSSLPMTEQMRGGGTACESTAWSSQTSVLCRVASGIMNTRHLLMTVRMATGSATQLFSMDGIIIAHHDDEICICHNRTQIAKTSNLSNLTEMSSVSDMTNVSDL